MANQRNSNPCCFELCRFDSCCSPWVGQVSIAGSAIATLQKELSSTHTAQKIIKPVKPPTYKIVETRLTPEPTPPPFRDATEQYQSHFDTELQRQIGASYTGEWETQVCNLG